MPYEIVDGEIANFKVDAIVNSTSTLPSIVSGTDSMILSKGGKGLFEDRIECGNITHDKPCITKAHHLPVKQVIHVNGPTYIDGNHHESEHLFSTYLNALYLAYENHVTSIAFPLISSGNLMFPRGQALNIALNAIKTFLDQYDMMIFLVINDQKENQISKTTYDFVFEYLDSYQQANNSDDFDPFLESGSFFQYAQVERRFEDLEFEIDISFQEALFKFIDKKGLNDVEVYKKANVDRRLFSKIKSDSDYHPSKSTSIAFAIALELNLDETKDLLLKAGYALSRSSVFDLIVIYCIENDIYDLFEINSILFAFDQKTIGCLE